MLIGTLVLKREVKISKLCALVTGTIHCLHGELNYTSLNIHMIFDNFRSLNSMRRVGCNGVQAIQSELNTNSLVTILTTSCNATC